MSFQKKLTNEHKIASDETETRQKKLYLKHI